MKIVILGANGYLGARLFYDLRKKHDVVGTYNRTQFFHEFVQLDITNEIQVKEFFQTQKPDIIIHAANYPSSRPAKDDPEGYIKVNLDSARYIQEAADAAGAKLVFISSFAAAFPTDVYGELKAKSEEVVKKTKVGWLILRPSLILGFSPNIENDRPFNRVLKCLDTKTVGEFDTSWKFQPTYIGHLSDVIHAAIEMNIFNKTVHVFSPIVVTQYSTAKDILAPFDIDVKPIDKGMNLKVWEKDEKELIDLGLPTCSYEEMIRKIHEEIRNRKSFTL